MLRYRHVLFITVNKKYKIE